MWTQHLSVTELQRIDQEARKIIVETLSVLLRCVT